MSITEELTVVVVPRAAHPEEGRGAHKLAGGDKYVAGAFWVIQKYNCMLVGPIAAKVYKMSYIISTIIKN